MVVAAHVSPTALLVFKVGHPKIYRDNLAGILWTALKLGRGFTEKSNNVCASGPLV